ncbi:MAG: family 78 glycoside hydrolase catalytic domain, partial [Anaerolineae bacterium]|nr:family 78 glycoside hydrolase catalytic domain [Thermoflexales bacterium]MDW8407779.1 family 78 glycoside hydrolase catalytic domain [Anaerolineae bacterium]
MTAIINLRCEYQTNPIGIGAQSPRLSWQMVSEQRGARQTAYQIRAAHDPDMQEVIWDTGKVISDQSIHIPYSGPPLNSGQRVYWQARLWDETDSDSGWSEPAFFEMGLLHESDWQARWITPDWDEDTTQSQPQPALRRAFHLNGAVKSARVYATSLGLYELHLNGRRVGDAVLTPGWTAYDKRLQVQTYDVTELVRPGDNAIGALLGDGWYRGWLGFERNRNTYGDRLALLLQLVVQYADGSTQVITSDDTWRATLGPIRMSDIYMGETYNAQMELPGWDAPGYDDSAWKGVRLYAHGKHMLIPQVGPYVKRQEELKPVQVIHTPAGEKVLDFGQNMVGWVRVTAQARAGHTLILRHAEVLDQHGNFYTANLRAAKQTTQYTFKGEGIETYEPRFTFMGFRYVKVEGWPDEQASELTLERARETFTGIVVHSDIPPAGEFECSNPLINQLQHNIVWGQKGNFVDVPTDCPQRDERLGWT